MAGALIEVQLIGGPEVQARLDRLLAYDQHELFAELGAAMESQTRRRIADEKASPLGVRWAPWSPRYAATRGPGKSLLQDEGFLLASIRFDASAREVYVGSPLEYAATHQQGRGRIPARPYFGLSPDNEDELEELARDYYLDRLLHG